MKRVVASSRACWASWNDSSARIGSRRSIGLEDVLEDSREFCRTGCNRSVVFFLGPPVGAAGREDVKDQYAVVADEGAAGFGNDGRVGDLEIIADALDAVDDRHGVLVQVVVDRKVAGRLGSFVVGAEATSDVDESKGRTHLPELDKDPGELADTRVDDVDVADLAAHVAVEQLQAIDHSGIAKGLDGIEYSGDVEAELGLDTGGVAPTTGRSALKLEPDTDQRACIESLCVFNQEFELMCTLDDGDNLPAKP